ncbi:hypothetical protein IE53DRAFT_368331 [Violaceomyces palustris]|uniref:Uncharacterized protein n=1 Tax=Violaceomyces palustris TaxID=1673888 RepID=A0ACD0NZ64_9BASI|nr:hypothetical protein IE53DRAFT_368331 [Violaceomyces palustris]
MLRSSLASDRNWGSGGPSPLNARVIGPSRNGGGHEGKKVIVPASPSKKRDRSWSVSHRMEEGEGGYGPKSEGKRPTLPNLSNERTTKWHQGSRLLEATNTILQQRRVSLPEEEGMVVEGEENSPSCSSTSSSITALKLSKVRSEGFHQPVRILDEERAGGSSGRSKRDEEDFTLIEELRIGPGRLDPNEEDPEWRRMEPFSGIRLKERFVSHQQMVSFLDMRYLIPPSMLYSVVRLPSLPPFSKDHRRRRHPDGDYQVPVLGDWLTIAVIAEKSEILVTKGRKVEQGDDDESLPAQHERLRFRGIEDDGDDDESLPAQHERLRFRGIEDDGDDDDPRLNLLPESNQSLENRSKTLRKVRGEEGVEEEVKCRKYMKIKLVDLSVHQGTDSTGKTRGDSILSLLLFQADEVVVGGGGGGFVRGEVDQFLQATREKRRETRYRNGSGGAFEKLCKEREGTVIAIMNPRVLRPWKGEFRGEKRDNILTITPTSQDSILVIGRSSDFCQCEAIKRDGKRCTAYVDLRGRQANNFSSRVCDFHLSLGLRSARMGRMDLSNSTTGLDVGNGHDGQGNGRSSGFGAEFNPHFGGRGGWKRKGFGRGGGKDQDDYEFNFEDSNRGKTFTVEDERGGGAREVLLDPTNPQSRRFDVGEALGRGKVEKDLRLKRKAESLRLENAICFKVAKGDLRSRSGSQGVKELSKASSSSNTSPEGVKNSPQSAVIFAPRESTNALELVEIAKRTLEERKRKRKREEKSSHQVSSPLIRRSGKGKREKSGGTGEGGGSRLLRDSNPSLVKNPFDPLTDEEEEGGGGGGGMDKVNVDRQRSPKRFSYSVEAIQKLGFNPLSGCVGKGSSNREGDGQEAKEERPRNDSRSNLLARTKDRGAVKSLTGSAGDDEGRTGLEKVPDLRISKKHRAQLKCVDRGASTGSSRSNLEEDRLVVQGDEESDSDLEII